jgi:Tol biopolymer transport system component
MELISAVNGMSPSWSPDGQRIAFLSNRAEGWDLYVMDADGGNVQRLTTGATSDDPAWSSDGRYIAIERDHRIEAVSPDSAERCVLASNASHPTWSPDGKLAFVRDHDLYIRDVNGAETLALRDADQPYWSPDGSVIAFTRRGICVLDLQSRAVVRQTHNPADDSPAMAADGDIIFVRNGTLVIIHPDDAISDLCHLPSPAGAPAPHPTELDRVAFHVHDGGNWDIATASLEHGNFERLTHASWTSWNARI